MVVTSAGVIAGALARGGSRPGMWALMALAKVAGALAFAAVVVIGLLYVRLMYGPIALNFLVHPIETGIAEELAGTGVRIESVALGLNESGLLQFELKNVRVNDAAGEQLVAAPTAAISLSRWALLSGRIAVESIDLISARLLLFYSDDGTLSLKFSPVVHAAEGERTKPSLRGSVDQPSLAVAQADGDGTLGRIDLIKVLSEASGRARRGEHASAYLRGVGLKSAIVVIDNGSRKSVWRVPEFDLDLDHRRSRSLIAGRAKIESMAGPWEIRFRSYERISAKALNLSVAVRGLIPRGLARTLPQLVVLEGLDLPISADAQLELSTAGEILTGKIVIDAAPGHLSLPWLAAAPIPIDSGHLELAYDGAARRFDIAPSVVSWGKTNVRLTGAISHIAQGADGPGWNVEVKSVEGWIAPEPPQRLPLPIDQLTVRGFFGAARGRIVLEEFVLRTGGTEVSAQGGISDMGGAMKARLDAKIGAMPTALFKTLWPGWVAPQTRSWINERLLRGDLQGGAFKAVHGSGPADAATPAGSGDRVSLTLEGSGLELALVEGWPNLEMPRGLLRLEGRTVEFTAPDASMTAADGRKLQLKGSFLVDLDEPLPRSARIALRGQGPPSLLLEMLDHETLRTVQGAGQGAGLALVGNEGKVDGAVNIRLPLVPNLKFAYTKVEGRLRITDGKVRHVLGSLDAHGVNLVIDMSPGAVEAKGDFLVKGVPAKVSWHRVHGAPADKQAPLRITASLDSSERAQLGFDLGDIVQGVVGVEITVAHDVRGERLVHVRADLLNAELSLEGVAWRKPVGRSCTFEFELAKGTSYPTELRNVRLVGDNNNVAIAGWIGAGADFSVKEFRFPQFSINIVTNFETHGKLRPDNVWQVTAKGPTYDGRELFQSFFDINPAGNKGSKQRPGLELHAEIDNVVGFHDTGLRNVKVSMQKHAGKLTQLDAHGTLVGNKRFEASVRPESGKPRMLVAKASDAGQMFKLVGFYAHAVGGDMSLEVNLDGKGAAERTGTLSAKRFHVLGEAVTVQNLPGAEPGSRRREVVREKTEFDSLHAPFSVGHGQFVLHDAAVEGPLVSATMRGKLDFRTRMLHVGGTFTPLSTFNKIFSGVPLVGDIVTGPRREGVFALNYALQGGLENPQLFINPLSAITPGFTREFMQITPNDPRVDPGVAPRRGRPGGGRNEKGPRAPGSPAAATSDGTSTGPADGWLSETSRPAEKKK